jgi:hypothetical protein
MEAVLQEKYSSSMTLEAAQELADEVWRIGADVDNNGEPDPALTENARPECGFLDRSTENQRKFRLLK